MNRWFKSIFAGLAVTTLVFLFYKKIIPPGKPEFYKVHYLLGSKLKEEILGELPFIIKKKISDMGYNSLIRIIKDNRMDIQVENVRDTFSLRQAIAQNMTAKKIEFREVYTLDELPGLFPATDKVSGKILAAANREETGIYSIISPLAPDEIDGRNVFPPAVGLLNKKDSDILNHILRQPVVLRALPEDLQFYYGSLTDAAVIRNNPDDIYLYAIRTGDEKSSINNHDIESAEMKYSDNNQPGVFLRLNNSGAGKWSSMTVKNTGRYIAMILDDIVTATPRIHDAKPGRWVMMNGKFSVDEAMIVVRQLNAKLPASGFAIIKEEILSETAAGRGKFILVLLLTFAIVAALTLLIFNNLKNK